MTDITAAFEASAGGAKVETVLDASSLLRERIEKGETAHGAPAGGFLRPLDIDPGFL